jgi:hypothetical protein
MVAMAVILEITNLLEEIFEGEILPFNKKTDCKIVRITFDARFTLWRGTIKSPIGLPGHGDLNKLLQIPHEQFSDMFTIGFTLPNQSSDLKKKYKDIIMDLSRKLNFKILNYQDLTKQALKYEIVLKNRNIL